MHSRVTAYRERGVEVDVFRLRKDEGMSYHEYQNVDVMTGSQDALHKLLSTKPSWRQTFLNMRKQSGSGRRSSPAWRARCWKSPKRKKS